MSMPKIKIKKIKPLFHIGTKELVGIDFSDASLKIAHLKVFPNRKELVNVLTRDIRGLSDEDISGIINDSFSRLNAKKAEVVTVIPSHMVITKNIEIPSTDPREIKDIINLQASRYTPYSREEIIVDYLDIDIYKHSYTKILLVIVARDVVKRQLEILHRAAIRTEKVVLATESLSWFAPNALKIDTMLLPISLVHIDQNFSDFIVISKDKPTFIRSISIGARQLLDEKEAYEARFIEEITKSLDGYQSEDIKRKPERLIIVGSVEQLKHLEPVLNESLHLPATVETSFKNLEALKWYLKAPLLEGRLSFLNIISSLFGHQKLRINLIPEEVKLRKSLEERGKELIKTGVLVIAIFVLGFSIFISKIYFKSGYLKKLDERFHSLNQEAESLEDDFVKIGVIRNYLSNRGYSLEILTELYNVAPTDLKLNDVKFDDGEGTFSIKGTAESMSTVFSFVDRMENSQYFKDVKTRYTTKRKDGLRDVTDFELNSLLVKETDKQP